MALITFVVAMLLCCFFSTAERPSTCSNPRGFLSWKALHIVDTGHMKYTGFNESVIVCTYISKLDEDRSAMSVTYNFSYQIGSDPVM
ncbi:unnamed protein product, partial [Ixodes hexagonus]